jgi:hypothetical protein
VTIFALQVAGGVGVPPPTPQPRENSGTGGKAGSCDENLTTASLFSSYPRNFLPAVSQIIIPVVDESIDAAGRRHRLRAIEAGKNLFLIFRIQPGSSN